MLDVTDHTVALLFSFATTLLWGVWGVTYKVSADRFAIPVHVFVVDWVVSVCLCTFVLASTFGTDLLFTASSGDMDFFNNLASDLTWKAWLLLMAAGTCAFLGNFLLLAGTEMAGMAIAFPIALSTAVFGGTSLNYLENPQGNGYLVMLGVVLAIVANLFASLAHWEHGGGGGSSSSHLGHDKNVEAFDERHTPDISLPFAPSNRMSNARSTVTSSVIDEDHAYQRSLKLKGTGACIVAGIFFSVWPTFLEYSMNPTDPTMPPLSPYTAFFLVTCFGVLAVVFVSAMFFLFPFRGCREWLGFYRPAPPSAFSLMLSSPTDYDSLYSNYYWSWHLLAFLGGAIWSCGTLMNIVASSTLGFAISYFLGQASVIIAVLIGLVVWREFAGSPIKAKVYLSLFFVAYLAAVLAISFSDPPADTD